MSHRRSTRLCGTCHERKVAPARKRNKHTDKPPRTDPRRLCANCDRHLCWVSPGRLARAGDGPRLCRPCRHGDVIVPTREPRPTRERPGSPGKIEELARRYEAGESLWHEGDAR